MAAKQGARAAAGGLGLQVMPMKFASQFGTFGDKVQYGFNIVHLNQRDLEFYLLCWSKIHRRKSPRPIWKYPCLAGIGIIITTL